MKSTKIKTKTDKGITLIALIITIVVLMILAAVAINSITNEGIIGKAENVANQYTEAQEKEQISLAITEWSMLKYTQPGTTLAEILGKEFGASNVVENEDGTVTVTTQKGNMYKVEQNGTIHQPKEPSILKVGSYVTYDVTYTDMYSGITYDNSEEGKYGWRYLGTDGENKLLVSTAIPMKLYYHYWGDGGSAKWWFEEETFSPKVRAATGMLTNLDKIPFAQKASGTSMSSGEENTAIGDFSPSKRTHDGVEYNAVGDYFKVIGKSYSDDITVRTLTLADLNKATNSANGNNDRTETSISYGFKDLIGDALGLFDMQDLTDYTADYTYWLATPYPSTTTVVYLVKSDYNVVRDDSCAAHGLRPVVVLSSDIEIVDENEDGIFELQ